MLFLVVELHKRGNRGSDRIWAKNGHQSDEAFSRDWNFTATSPENVNKICYRNNRNPERSMRNMAKKLGISVRTQRFRSWELNCWHFLNETIQMKRFTNSRRILRQVTGDQSSLHRRKNVHYRAAVERPE